MRGHSFSIMNDYFLIGDDLLQDSDGGAFQKLEQYLFSLDSEEGNKYQDSDFLRELLYELIWRFLDGKYDINYLQKLLCGINEKEKAAFSSVIYDLLWMIGIPYLCHRF